MSTPPILDPAGLVNEGWNTFSSKALLAFDQGLQFANSLGTFNINPVNYDATFIPPSGNGLVFNRPLRPDEPQFDYSISLPDPLQLEIPRVPGFPSAPEFESEPPVLDFSGMPKVPDFGSPPAAPELDQVDIPDAPTLVMPDVPPLTALNLPQPPELLDIEFEGIRPRFDGVVPDAAIDFVEEDYQSECLDRIKVEIKRMLDTGTGMPAALEQMLVDRLSQREDRESTRAVQEAMEEASSRGFSSPPGRTMRRVQQARQRNQELKSSRHREVFVQRRQEEIQNFQFAIAQGIGLENILINLHLNVMQRAFDLSRAVADLKFRQLEAEVTIYNAALQGYQVDAQVYEARLRAELQKLERFRLQIQAEALKQEIDRNKVAIYTAQLEAVRNVVDIYRAQVEAARAVAEKNNAEIRAYIGQIEGYRAEIDASRTEFELWNAKIRGELGKVQAYEAETRGFLARVQAYDTEVRAATVQPRLEIDIESLRLQEFTSRLDTVRTQIQNEGQRATALASVYGSQAQMYAADGQLAENETAARDRNFRSALESRRTESERALAQAQLDIEQVLRGANILSSALDSAGRISSQLSAGAMSAVSLSAGINGSVGTSYNYRF